MCTTRLLNIESRMQTEKREKRIDYGDWWRWRKNQARQHESSSEKSIARQIINRLLRWTVGRNDQCWMRLQVICIRHNQTISTHICGLIMIRPWAHLPSSNAHHLELLFETKEQYTRNRTERERSWTNVALSSLVITITAILFTPYDTIYHPKK